jgi:hypothetical protein
MNVDLDELERLVLAVNENGEDMGWKEGFEKILDDTPEGYPLPPGAETKIKFFAAISPDAILELVRRVRDAETNLSK